MQEYKLSLGKLLSLQQSYVETKYHCTDCNDFDSCVHSYKKEKLKNMEKISLDLEDGSFNNQKQVNPQETKKLSVQRSMKILKYVCQCWNFNCRLTNYRQLKNVLQYVKLCKIKSKGNCSFCKQYIDLYIYHAKWCTDVKCSVFLCSNIKRKIKQQHVQQKLQQKYVEIKYYCNPKAKKLSIQKCMEILIHICQYWVLNCRL